MNAGCIKKYQDDRLNLSANHLRTNIMNDAHPSDSSSLHGSGSTIDEGIGFAFKFKLAIAVEGDGAPPERGGVPATTFF